MRIYLFILVAFLALTNAAWGGIGDAGVSEGFPNLQPPSNYVAGASLPNSLASQVPTTTTQWPPGSQQPLSGSGPSQDIAANQMGLDRDTNPNTQASNIYSQNWPS